MTIVSKVWTLNQVQSDSWFIAQDLFFRHPGFTPCHSRLAPRHSELDSESLDYNLR